MSSFLQHGSRARHGPAMRPLVVGALTCGALLAAAPAAVANHVRMADGTLCPHAAGTPVPGEAAPIPGPVRATSSAPIAASSTVKSSPGQPAKPATKPASQGPSKGASQATAQHPAGAQAQAQRPAAAAVSAQRPAAVTQPAAKLAARPTPAQADGVTSRARHQAPFAQKRVTTAAKTVAGQPAASASADKWAARTQTSPSRPAATVEPAATVTPAVAKADESGSYATWMGVFGLLVVGLIGAFVGLVRRARTQHAGRAVAQPTVADETDAAIEAELQAMILETKARAMREPGELEAAGDDRRLGISA